MTIKLEEGEDILWITVVSEVVGKWYRAIKDTTSKIRYEDAVQNYLLNHLHLLRVTPVRSFWVEDKLRETDEEGLMKIRADVIVEYDDQVWLIEVKGHNANLTDVFDSEKCRTDKNCSNAVKQLRDYENKIKELGWWKGKEKEIQKVVFWCHNTKGVIGNEQIPIDLDETSKWTVCRGY